MGDLELSVQTYPKTDWIFSSAPILLKSMHGKPDASTAIPAKIHDFLLAKDEFVALLENIWNSADSARKYKRFRLPGKINELQSSHASRSTKSDHIRWICRTGVLHDENLGAG